MIVCQNHVFLPNKMICIFTAINLWVGTTKSVLCRRRILLSRASDATFNSTIATDHLLLTWAILKESWMKFVFWLVTESGSVSPLLIVSLGYWSVDVVWFEALLWMYLVLVLGSCSSVFVLPWALDALQSVRTIAWPKSLLSTSVLPFCRSAASFVVVRVGSRIGQRLATRMWPRTRSLAPWYMMFHIATRLGKLGRWLIRVIWCRPNTCIMFQSFLVTRSMRFLQLLTKELILLVVIALFWTGVVALVIAFFIVKPLRIEFIAVIPSTQVTYHGIDAHLGIDVFIVSFPKALSSLTSTVFPGSRARDLLVELLDVVRLNVDMTTVAVNLFTMTFNKTMRRVWWRRVVQRAVAFLVT